MPGVRPLVPGWSPQPPDLGAALLDCVFPLNPIVLSDCPIGYHCLSSSGGGLWGRTAQRWALWFGDATDGPQQISSVLCPLGGHPRAESTAGNREVRGQLRAGRKEPCEPSLLPLLGYGPRSPVPQSPHLAGQGWEQMPGRVLDEGSEKTEVEVSVGSRRG